MRYKFMDLSNYDLASVLNDFMAAASLRWDDFTELEIQYFRAMEAEACRRFIAQNLQEEATDDKSYNNNI